MANKLAATHSFEICNKIHKNAASINSKSIKIQNPS